MSRECEEREELTAALSKAQEELAGLRSPAYHQGSTRSHPKTMERDTPPGEKHFHLHSQARVILTRRSTTPNTLRHSPARTNKDRGQGTDGGGTGRSVESWNGGGLSGGEKQQGGALPKLKTSNSVSEVKRKASLVMGTKERL